MGDEPVEVPPGVDGERVGAWLEASIEGLKPPFRYRLIAGGRSNLTFLVVDRWGRRMVLRRPPLGTVLATAHDMLREHRIISALGPTDVPVPVALAACDDPEVNGAPFYVMSHVDGVIVRDVEVGRTGTDHAFRQRAAESLTEVLLALHDVDVDAVGLGQLGRKEGYVERQLKRWSSQFQASKTRELPQVDEVHARLAATMPPQQGTGIVHGDYRLDNCVCHPDGRLAAVLDWELCTLGDPLADLGMLLICWAEEGRLEDTARPDAATQLPGFGPRSAVLERYAAGTWRDVSQIGWYCAFNYWRLACISEGVYARYRSGQMGEQADVDVDVLGQGPPRLAGLAAAELDRLER